jgi:hypothetical protein
MIKPKKSRPKDSNQLAASVVADVIKLSERPSATKRPQRIKPKK